VFLLLLGSFQPGAEVLSFDFQRLPSNCVTNDEKKTVNVSVLASEMSPGIEINNLLRHHI